MRSTVVLAIEDDKDFLKSILSVVDNSSKPTNICMVSNSNISEKSLQTIDVFFNSCCDKSITNTENTKEYTIKTINHKDINYTYIKLNNTGLDAKGLKTFAVKYMYSKTDIFFTLSSGSVYLSNFIETMIDKFKDNLTGVAYSDYIANGRYKYLSTIHPMVNFTIPIEEMAFSKNVVDKESFNCDSLEIIRKAFEKSIIRYIPEALFVT
jgi:hypothetical protein